MILGCHLSLAGYEARSSDPRFPDIAVIVAAQLLLTVPLVRLRRYATAPHVILGITLATQYVFCALLLGDLLMHSFYVLR